MEVVIRRKQTRDTQPPVAESRHAGEISQTRRVGETIGTGQSSSL